MILWMALIFILSHQPATESSELSSGITKKLYDMIKLVVPNISLDQGTLDHVIRKSAHFSIYLILGLLVSNSLINSNISRLNSILLALLICILYAISDEIHQIFILGRSGQVSDVLIDSSGGLVGVLLLHAIRRRKSKECQNSG